MADNPKVHVFLGAPHPQSVSEEDLDQGVYQWKTLDFSWSQGKLRAKEGTHTDVAGQAIDRLSSTNLTPESNKRASEDDVTPSISESFLDKQTNQAEADLCPGLVTEYLNRCFTASLSCSHPNPGPSKAMSAKTEYLTTWTKSQGLLLKAVGNKDCDVRSLDTPGSPQTPPKQTLSASVSSLELYSPQISPGDGDLVGTLKDSVGLYESLSQWQQSGEILLLRTPNGILCSQVHPSDQEDPEVEAGSSNTSLELIPTPRTSKRPKLSPVSARSHQGTGQKTMFILDRPTTLLSRCRSLGVSYSIMVAVVHPCHLKEIKAKSGASADASIPLATVIVTDQSGLEMKVVLWRAAAFWALTVHSGDILLITGVRLHKDKWRGETVLQSSYMSQLLNLGQITRDRIPQPPQNVNVHTLRALCTHLYEKRPLLTSLPPRTAQDLNSIPFAQLGSLRPDTLVHALLRVKHSKMTTEWRDEVQGVSRTGGVSKAVLTVEQEKGRQGAMVLWGAALSWLQNINTNKEAVWEFRLLLVKQDATSGLMELHSTPWSSCQPLSPTDPRYKEFCTTISSHRGSSSFEIDLHTLLSQKYTGDVELRVQITAFQFQSSPSQDAVHLIDAQTPLERILDVVCGDITFTGCGLCCAELDTDENGIYRPCYPCLPHTGVRRYYRPVVLTVREGQSQVCVQVPPMLVQKILNIPPDKLNKTVAPESEEKFVQVVANRIHCILSTLRPAFHLTIHSHFDCDENSIPIVQSFLLLDFTEQQP